MLPRLRRFPSPFLPPRPFTSTTTSSASPISEPRIRNMPLTTAPPPPPQHEWLIILPDHAGALHKRLSVRKQHLEELAPKVGEGFWTMGGAILSEPVVDPAAPKIEGSVMLARAETREEVVEQLRRDTYFRSGVWDWEKVVIYPFKSAIRKEL